MWASCLCLVLWGSVTTLWFCAGGELRHEYAHPRDLWLLLRFSTVRIALCCVCLLRRGGSLTPEDLTGGWERRRGGRGGGGTLLFCASPQMERVYILNFTKDMHLEISFRDVAEIFPTAHRCPLWTTEYITKLPVAGNKFGCEARSLPGSEFKGLRYKYC